MRRGNKHAPIRVFTRQSLMCGSRPTSGQREGRGPAHLTQRPGPWEPVSGRRGRAAGRWRLTHLLPQPPLGNDAPAHIHAALAGAGGGRGREPRPVPGRGAACVSTPRAGTRRRPSGCACPPTHPHRCRPCARPSTRPQGRGRGHSSWPSSGVEGAQCGLWGASPLLAVLWPVPTARPGPTCHTAHGRRLLPVEDSGVQRLTLGGPSPPGRFARELFPSFLRLPL